VKNAQINPQGKNMSTLREIANEGFAFETNQAEVLTKLVKRVKQAVEAYEEKTGEKISQHEIPFVSTPMGLVKLTYLDDSGKIASASAEIEGIENFARESAMAAASIDKDLEQIAYANVKLRLIANNPVLNNLGKKSIQDKCEF
jgi:hypothetical protein